MGEPIYGKTEKDNVFPLAWIMYTEGHEGQYVVRGKQGRQNLFFVLLTFATLIFSQIMMAIIANMKSIYYETSLTKRVSK